MIVTPLDPFRNGPARGASTNNTVDYSCDVAVIDLSVPAIIATQSFKETSGEQGYQDVLYPEILAYLVGLPRQSP